MPSDCSDSAEVKRICLPPSSSFHLSLSLHISFGSSPDTNPEERQETARPLIRQARSAPPGSAPVPKRRRVPNNRPSFLNQTAGAAGFQSSSPPLLSANLLILRSLGETDNEDGVNPPSYRICTARLPIVPGLSNVNQQCKQQSLHVTVLHRYNRARQRN